MGANKPIPSGFEILQLNYLFDKVPENAFHHWIDLETGKISVQILVPIKKEKPLTKKKK